MADHEHGKMDTHEQEKTYEGFVRASGWSIGGILIFLILLFLIAG
ncbi:MAG: aa3-type cytochrome c oxidase subunit IV [Shimia sp.]